MGPGTFPSAGLLSPAASSGAPGGSINWRGLYDAAAADLADARDAFIRAFQTAAGMRDNYTLGEGDTDAGARGEVRGPSAMSLAGLGMTGAAPGGLLAAPRGGAVLGAGPIRAYHGSPHNFDRFDISKIGTGEGAQAYGHGLYFAEKEGLARSYRDALSNRRYTINGEPADVAGKYGQDVVDIYFRNGGDKTAIENTIWGMRHRIHQNLTQDGLKDISQYKPLVQYQGDVPSNMLALNDRANRLEALVKSGDVSTDPGRMYEVAIHADPARFLDWDRKLVQQPQVRDALRQAGFISPQGRYEAFVANTPAYGADVVAALKEGASEGSRRLAGTPQKAAEYLRDAGIPGIRYLDAGSRSAGDGSRNYVVFDDKLIEILRKYGMLPAAIGGGAAAAAQPVGLLEQ